MGIYKKINQREGSSDGLYASVKEDGNKATIHTPFGTKVYKKVDAADVSDDLLMKIRSNPDLKMRDLIPYIDCLGNYIFLTNKPRINGVVLEGNLSTEDLNIFGRITAQGVYFNDGDSLQEKFDNGDLGVKSYSKLDDKPSLNGVTLDGKLNNATLGIIDDESITDAATWSSLYIQTKLNNFSVTTELVGTDEHPIIASELSLGSYVISGKVQSSNENTMTIRVPRKQYLVNRDIEDMTVLWDGNPYTNAQYYIAFYHTEVKAPIEKKIEILTKDDVATLSFDCGEF